MCFILGHLASKFSFWHRIWKISCYHLSMIQSTFLHLCNSFYFVLLTRHTSGADFTHYDPLGPGIIYPEPRTCSYDVQPSSQAVRWAGWAHACPSQGLHHQPSVNSWHYGPSGVFGSDPLTAYCSDGSRRGEAYDSKHWVRCAVFWSSWLQVVTWGWN